MVRVRRFSSSDDDEDPEGPLEVKRRKTTVPERDDGFSGILREAGLEVRSPEDGCHLLHCNQDECLRRLKKILSRSIDYDDHCRRFVDALVAYLEEDGTHSRLSAALQPCKVASDVKNSRGTFQDSLIRLLLEFEDTQAKLIEWLLEKMALLTLVDDGQDQGGFSQLASQGKMNGLTQSQAKASLPKMILSQMKWLTKIVKGHELADKILDVMNATPAQIQQEIIVCLPEIVPDQAHGKLGMALRDLMNQSSSDAQMNKVIIETFGALSLDQEVLGEIQQSILKTVSTIAPADLPVIIKFIIDATEPGQEMSVVQELRENVDLTPHPMFIATQMSQKPRTQNLSLLGRKKNQPSVENGEDVSLLMDVFGTLITNNKKIGDAFFRSIDTTKHAKDLKPLDFFVLIILHRLPVRQKQVESLLKNKIRAGILNEDFITKLFGALNVPLKLYFETLLSITEAMMSCQEQVLQNFATILCREMFLHFDKFCQQEIVADLVTNIRSGSSENVRAASLVTLSYLTFKHTDKLLPYAMFTTGILEYLDTMPLPQARQVMDVLSTLAYANPTHASVLRDDIHIVIKKQLSQTDLKKMGVVGSVAVVKNMSMSTNHERVDTSLPSQDTSSGGSILPTSVLKQAKEVLERVKASTKAHGEIGGLFMDELSHVVESRKLDRRLEKWVADTMANDFQDEFVVDFTNADLQESVDRDDDFIPLSLRYSLEQTESDQDNGDEPPINIAINLGRMVAPSAGSSSMAARKPSAAACRLIQHFRLLRICISAQNKGDLGDIDALLGCPLWLPKQGVVEKFDSLAIEEKNAICSMLFYAVNWFRELLNAFADQEDNEYRTKVVLRLKDIIQVQKDLSLCLPLNSGFVPPSAHYLFDSSKWQPPVTNAEPSGKKGIPSKDKKGLVKGHWRLKKNRTPKSVDDGADCTTANATVMPTAVPSPNKTKSPGSASGDEATSLSLDFKGYAPFVRELDLSVFSVLSYDAVSIGSKGAEGEERENPKLRPPELLFLLEDLNDKLNNVVLSATTKKPSPFGAKNKTTGFANFSNINPKVLVEKTVELLDYILTDLEVTTDYFKRLVDMNDGVIDQRIGLLGGDVVEILISVSEKSLLILNHLFGWGGFQSQCNRNLLKKALAIVARRSNSAFTERFSVEELTVAAIKYLERFSGVVLTIAEADAFAKMVNSMCLNLAANEGENEAATILSTIVRSFLTRIWLSISDGEREKGSKHNGHVESLLKIYLASHTTPYAVIKDYMDSDALGEVIKKESDYCSSVFPTFNKQTLGLHFRLLFQHLVSCIRSSITYGTSKNHDAQFDIWSEAVGHLHKFVGFIGEQRHRQLIAVVIKNSRMFIDHFLRHGMPLLDTLFRRKREECVGLLKNLQQSTRFLQNVCSHSKISKDVALSNHVPPLKKSLETLLFRVKAMLALNSEAEVFWMGNLKNRDLKGEEIMSQDEDDEGSSTTANSVVESGSDQSDVGDLSDDDNDKPDQDRGKDSDDDEAVADVI